MSPLRSVIYHRLPQEVFTASSSERPLPMIKNYVRDQKDSQNHNSLYQLTFNSNGSPCTLRTVFQPTTDLINPIFSPQK